MAQAWSTWRKSIELLDYQEHTGLDNGLEKMWHWARRAWDRYPRRRDPKPLDYEIRRGLYSWWEAPSVAQDSPQTIGG